ncbi:MAG: hypothetical protein P9X24_15580 [Candidatus Hatepunaea meridiana]|nr:hypothetical protein [Candidatus Hatepunaea meridiana]
MPVPTPSLYFNPVIDVTLTMKQISPLVSRLGVVSDLLGKADTCVVMVADYGRSLSRSVKQGDPLIIKWGYAGEELVDIFRGVVRSVGIADPVVIRGIDYNTILNDKRVQVTFEEETVSGIIRAVLADTGIELDIDDCEFEIDRLPFFNRTVRECVDTVTDLVRRESGEYYFDYIRDGVFHWGTKNISGSPVHAFRMGVNIIRQEACQDGLSFIETLVVPVRHSEIIEVNDERCFVVKAEYLWEGGGRTRLWYEHAA